MRSGTERRNELAVPVQESGLPNSVTAGIRSLSISGFSLPYTRSTVTVRNSFPMVPSDEK
jgi:hypothetical protein